MDNYYQSEASFAAGFFLLIKKIPLSHTEGYPRDLFDPTAL